MKNLNKFKELIGDPTILNAIQKGMLNIKIFGS